MDKINPIVKISSAVQDLPTDGADVYYCECKVVLEDCVYAPTYSKMCPDGSAPINETSVRPPANGNGIVVCPETKAACEDMRLEIPAELKIERINKYGPYNLALIKETEVVKKILEDYELSDENIKKFDCDQHCNSFAEDHNRLLKGHCTANAPRPAPPDEVRGVPLLCE